MNDAKCTVMGARYLRAAVRYCQRLCRRECVSTRQASARAEQADQHAVDAGIRAQQAQLTAQQANQHLQTMQTAVNDLDQYQPSTDAELRFPTGQTTLGAKAKAAPDQIADSVKDQRGYIIEVQGFAPGNGQWPIPSSVIWLSTTRSRCTAFTRSERAMQS